MFRRVIAAWLYVALGLLAASCVHRPTLDVLKPIGNLPSNTKKVRLLVATTRLPGSVEDRDAFGAGRSHGVNFAALTISVPPRHVLGKIEWPDAIPGDPNKHFVVVDRASLSRDQFLERVEETPGGALEAGSILVFVHGYNTLYQEAVYRFAQIVHDSGYQGTAVLFAWPSLGKAPLYLADRDASTYSRDHLERTLIEMASRQGAKEINLLAHSMGTWLAVEALRQARMSKRVELMSKLGDVILASPDIDIDVFRTQLEVIGILKRPITILVSGDDRALALSAALGGGMTRVGQLTAQDHRASTGAALFNLRVVDLTRVDTNAPGNHHAKFADSPAVISAIGRGLGADAPPATAGAGLAIALTEVGGRLARAPVDNLKANGQ